MIKVEVQTRIDRPIEEVFDRLANLASYSEWMPESSLLIESNKTSDGDIGMGTTFSDKVKFGKAVGEITQFQRPKKLAFRQILLVMGMEVMESRPAYNLETQNGTTVVQHHAEGDLFGGFKLFEPWVAKLAESERKRTVYALKESFQ